jgi:hypothetical protein
MKPIRVRLRVDLTRYDAAFAKGVEGWVVARSTRSDRFFLMRLDTGERLEVL